MLFQSHVGTKVPDAPKWPKGAFEVGYFIFTGNHIHQHVRHLLQSVQIQLYKGAFCVYESFGPFMEADGTHSPKGAFPHLHKA